MSKRKSSATVQPKLSLIDLAGPVSDRVQIKQVILAESVSRRKALWTTSPGDVALDVSVKTESRRPENLVQVLPKFTLIGRESVDNPEEMLRIEALFVVQYEVPNFEGIAEANLDAFGRINGVYNVWPYWREFVQSMMLRMGLPSLTMPVFRPLAGGVQQPAEEESHTKAPTARRTTR